MGTKHQVLVRMDHNNLQYFKKPQNLNCHQARWMQKMANYNFLLEHRLEHQHKVVDFLSRPLRENEGKDDNTKTTFLPVSKFTKMKFPAELEQRRKILACYYNHPLAGHSGIDKTKVLVKWHFEDKGVNKFMEAYV